MTRAGMAKWSARTLAVGACSLLTLGCGAASPRRATAPVHDHWLSSYVLGTWGKAELDVRDDCPDSGAASIRVGSTWRTVIATALTLGIYSPREAQVRCRATP